MKWKTANGEKLEIKNMTDNHLLNTIKFIARNTENYINNTKNFYLNCSEPNGEMARDCFDTEFYSVMEMDLEDLLDENKHYQRMLKEVKKRKL